MQWLPNFRTAATRAHRFLRRFLTKATTVSPEHFESYILSKTMPMYLQMHMEDAHFIPALPRGRPNNYIRRWINRDRSEQQHKSYLDQLFDFLSTFTVS